MPLFGGKFASVVSHGVASTASKFGSVTASRETMPAITGLPLFRGPQIKEMDLAEDRLAKITSQSLNFVTGIDLTATGTTTLFTAPSDQAALIFGVLLQVTAANTVTVAPDVSLGLNPSTANVFDTESLIGFNAVDDLYIYWANKHTAVTVANGGLLDLDVSVAATATTLTTTARVLGLLI